MKKTNLKARIEEFSEDKGIIPCIAITWLISLIIGVLLIILFYEVKGV